MKLLVKSFLHVFLLSLFSLSAGAQATISPQSGERSDEISDQEFNRFVETMQAIGEIQQEIQQEMVAEINKAGLETNRFNELAQARFDPNKEVEASEDEEARFEQALVKVQSMQTDMQSVITETIEENGFTMQRYQEIATVINSDPELQQQMQEKMESNN